MSITFKLSVPGNCGRRWRW